MPHCSRTVAKSARGVQDTEPPALFGRDRAEEAATGTGRIALALAPESGLGKDSGAALGAAALPLMIDNVSSSASGDWMRHIAPEPALVQSEGSRCPSEDSRRIFKGAIQMFSQCLGLAHRICICTSAPGSLFGGKGMLGPR